MSDNGKTTSVTIRAPKVDVAKWEQVANLSGLGFSEWIRRTLNDETIGVVKRSELAEEPKNLETAVESERRSVPRGNSTPKHIADVTHEVIRKTGIAKKTCAHGVEAGYHCWQCGGMAQVGDSEKKRGRR